MIPSLVGTRFAQLAKRNAQPSGYEQIGDKSYKVVLMPDGKIWMCENLDYGSSGVYYDNDEPTYGWNGLKCGKLYTWDEAVAAASAISGWHLPTDSEWYALAVAVGGSGTAGTKLKALDDSATSEFPSGWGGTDDYGFGVLPAGNRLSGSFRDLSSQANFWTATEYQSTYAYAYAFDTGASTFSNMDNKTNYAFSVRLVKD